ncbi:MAG: pyrroline-5-carboxylate reductase dimerization domain-containing protein [Mesorhizobium sp.]|mgnify:CR=1 FL=1
MTPLRTIGIIGGNGWLGRAIGHALLDAGLIEPSGLTLSCRAGTSGTFADRPQVVWTADNQELVRRSQVVIVSVRPEQFPAVAVDARDRLVISVMAGVSMETLFARTGSDRVVRALPNAAAEIGRSYTPWFCSDAVSFDDKALVQALFESCGAADEVETQAAIDYLTALSGSGPAFPALLAEAMLGHARAHGLPETIARRAVAGVVCDASQLLARPGASPAETVRTFMEYRGTTDAGLRAMQDAGFTKAVHAGLSAAVAKAVSMAEAQADKNRK